MSTPEAGGGRVTLVAGMGGRPTPEGHPLTHCQAPFPCWYSKGARLEWRRCIRMLTGTVHRAEGLAQQGGCCSNPLTSAHEGHMVSFFKRRNSACLFFSFEKPPDF